VTCLPAKAGPWPRLSQTAVCEANSFVIFRVILWPKKRGRFNVEAASYYNVE